MITREDIKNEALSWLGTPYHHEAMVKGAQGGVDCAMINIAVYRDFAGKIPTDFDPRPYTMQWHLHRSEERYLNWFTQYAKQVDAPEVGDVILFKFGRTTSHSGIYIGNGVMVHALRAAGLVLLEHVSTYKDRITGYWSII